jgi:hypothetical protein
MPGYVRQFEAMSQTQRESAIQHHLDPNAHRVLDDDRLNDMIAVTNATGWAVDEYEALDVDIRRDSIRVGFRFTASGAQEDEKVFNGD